MGLSSALKANQSFQAATRSWAASPRSRDRGVSVKWYILHDSGHAGRGRGAVSETSKAGKPVQKGLTSGLLCRQPALKSHKDLREGVGATPQAQTTLQTRKWGAHSHNCSMHSPVGMCLLQLQVTMDEALKSLLTLLSLASPLKQSKHISLLPHWYHPGLSHQCVFPRLFQTAS